MSEATGEITTNIVFLRQEGQVLLAMKKRGLGAGKWNGVGGKIEPGESIEQAAVREAEEEIGVIIGEKALEHVADVRFYGGTPGYLGSRVYFADVWEGEPQEKEEMRPHWFDIDKLPFDDMWSGDKIWIPEVLAGRKIQARVQFDDDNNLVDCQMEDMPT